MLHRFQFVAVTAILLIVVSLDACIEVALS